MTTIELNARKMEIIEMLLQVDDEKTVSEIMTYIRKAKGDNPPCRFTVEEMKQRIAKAEDDIKNGRFIPHEEIKRKVNAAQRMGSEVIPIDQFVKNDNLNGAALNEVKCTLLDRISRVKTADDFLVIPSGVDMLDIAAIRLMAGNKKQSFNA